MTTFQGLSSDRRGFSLDRAPSLGRYKLLSCTPVFCFSVTNWMQSQNPCSSKVEFIFGDLGFRCCIRVSRSSVAIFKYLKSFETIGLCSLGQSKWTFATKLASSVYKRIAPSDESDPAMKFPSASSADNDHSITSAAANKHQVVLQLGYDWLNSEPLSS